MKEPGMSCIKLANLDFPKFKKAVNTNPVISLREVPENILAQQHKEFIKYYR